MHLKIQANGQPIMKAGIDFGKVVNDTGALINDTVDLLVILRGDDKLRSEALDVSFLIMGLWGAPMNPEKIVELISAVDLLITTLKSEGALIDKAKAVEVDLITLAGDFEQ